MTFDLRMWPCFIHRPSLISIRLQLFNWGQFYIFNLSYNLTSYDLWPWYVTFDLINKWRSPCCTYDPSLVEIHQSMRNVQANVNPFSQQTTTTTKVDKVIPMCLSCYGRQHTQKRNFPKEIVGVTVCSGVWTPPFLFLPHPFYQGTLYTENSHTPFRNSVLGIYHWSYICKNQGIIWCQQFTHALSPWRIT